VARYHRAITSRQRLLTLAAYVTAALCWSGSWTADNLYQR